MSLYANVNNSKKEVTGLFGNVNGEKKEIVSLWANKNGVATKIYNSAGQAYAPTRFLPKGFCMIVRNTPRSQGTSTYASYITKDMQNFYKLSSSYLYAYKTFFEDNASKKQCFVNRVNGSVSYLKTKNFTNFQSDSSEFGGDFVVYFNDIKKTFQAPSKTGDSGIYFVDGQGNNSVLVGNGNDGNTRPFYNTDYFHGFSILWDAISYASFSVEPDASSAYTVDKSDMMRINGVGDVVVGYNGVYFYDDFLEIRALDEQHRIAGDSGYLCCQDIKRDKVYCFDVANKRSGTTVCTIREIKFDGTVIVHSVNFTDLFATTTQADICWCRNCNKPGKGIMAVLYDLSNQKYSLYYIKSVDDLINKEVGKWFLVFEGGVSDNQIWDVQVEFMPVSDEAYNIIIQDKTKVQ